MKQFFTHFFLPHHTNNHRPKILHNLSLFILLIALFGVSALVLVGKQSHPEVLGISYSISDTEMLILVNQERAKGNLPALVMNDELKQAAAGKAANMFQNDYWAHFGPDGTTPWQFIRGAGYDYIDAGENLAKGFTSSQDVVTAWMNSPTHRENIMSPKYHDIGFAIVPGVLQGEQTVLVVQMFGSRDETPVVERVPQEVVIQTQAASNEAALPQTQKPLVLAQQQSQLVQSKPLVHVDAFSKSMLIVLFVTLLVVFILDLLIVERNRVPRIVGHNVDHIILITLFILFILLFKNGFVM